MDAHVWRKETGLIRRRRKINFFSWFFFRGRKHQNDEIRANPGTNLSNVSGMRTCGLTFKSSCVEILLGRRFQGSFSNLQTRFSSLPKTGAKKTASLLRKKKDQILYKWYLSCVYTIANIYSSVRRLTSVTFSPNVLSIGQKN